MNDIEADLLIAALRHNYAPDLHVIEDMQNAANQLESKQSRITELEAQLSESQRREQAAVADIEKMMRICEKGSCHFCANGDCTESPYCSPKWRGPVAGKGDAARV